MPKRNVGTGLSVGASSEPSRIPLIRTKLHRPKPAPESVTRPRLLEKLERALQLPLTLVVAPAGYGKSVLVSQWAESLECPFVWLSLDGSDSDPKLFLSYLLDGVDILEPTACHASRELLEASSLPPANVIGAHLVNDLDALDGPLVLVLDDYHRIDASSPVHDLVRILLEHPPRGLHVVIVARRDPPLPVALLWGGRHATGLRVKDLEFNREETVELLAKSAGLTVSEEALANLEHQLEGWAIGLRLLSLRLQSAEDPDAFVRHLEGGLPRTQDYLLQEVLAEQDPSVRRGLLRSSVLDRFCTEVLDVILEDEAGAVGPSSGTDLLKVLEQSGLIVSSGGARGHWLRYHRVLRDFLYSQLQRELSPKDIAQLHARASAWFESKGLIDESIQHALRAGDPHRAGDVVARHRFVAVERSGCSTLERWLSLLPEQTPPRPALLSARLFALTGAYRLAEMPPLLEQMEDLAEDEPLDEALSAELNLHRSVLHLWHECDGDATLRRLEPLQEQDVFGSGLVAARAESYVAFARHLVGQGEQATRGLRERIRATEDRQLLAHLKVGLTVLQIMSGDLPGALLDGGRAIEAAKRAGNPSLEAWSHYLRGNAHFNGGQLAGALEDFDRSVNKRHVLNRRVALDALLGRVLTCQAMHRYDDAAAGMDDLEEFAREGSRSYDLSLAASSRARLMLQANDVKTAARWADDFDGALIPSDTFFVLEVPVLTQCRAWIAAGTRVRLDKALSRLLAVRKTVESLHLMPQLIEVLVLQAIALEKSRLPDEARAALDEVLALAGPRGFVRPFVEAGPAMRDLLDRAARRTEASSHARRLQAMCRDGESLSRLATASPPSSTPLVTASSLTNRETEILELLGSRLRDKEIAEMLAISPATVHSHLQRLYRKLEVRGRRHAVEKARSLGVLAPPTGHHHR